MPVSYPAGLIHLLLLVSVHIVLFGIVWNAPWLTPSLHFQTAFLTRLIPGLILTPLWFKGTFALWLICSFQFSPPVHNTSRGNRKRNVCLFASLLAWMYAHHPPFLGDMWTYTKLLTMTAFAKRLGSFTRGRIVDSEFKMAAYSEALPVQRTQTHIDIHSHTHHGCVSKSTTLPI